MNAPTRQTGSEIISVLEGTWKEIQARHPELPDVLIITGSGVDSAGSRWAHFWRERWADKNDVTRLPELFIAGERLACGATLTLQSMLHEAVHALAYVRDVVDTDKGNRYHNRKFRDLAVTLGLEFTHDAPCKTLGFSAVTITDVAVKDYETTIERLDSAIRTYLPGFSDLALNGGDAGSIRIPVDKRPKSKTPSRNYVKAQCQCLTPRTIRVSRATLEEGDLMCGKCGSEFEEA